MYFDKGLYGLMSLSVLTGNGAVRSWTGTPDQAQNSAVGDIQFLKLKYMKVILRKVRSSFFGGLPKDTQRS